MIELRADEGPFRQFLSDRVTRQRVGDVLKLRNTQINTFDIDGVIFINKEVGGINPRPTDLIITGRSHEERPETEKMLQARRINNPVFMNQVDFDQKTRQSSGVHKGTVLNTLIEHGFKIGCHFEDDEIQAAEIRKLCPSVVVVMIVHELTNKENVRHAY